MLLDLTTIRVPHERYDREYGPSAFLPEPEYRVAAAVSLGFDIFKSEAQFRLVGSVRTVLEVPCSRCLEPFSLPVDASFDLLYQPQSANTGGGEDEIEVEADDLATAFYENDEIDLGQLMREQFYLTLPMKPLCGESCRGLCPECGANLNLDACGCLRRWEDPRLAALKALRRD